MKPTDADSSSACTSAPPLSSPRKRAGPWCGPCFCNTEGSFYAHGEFLGIDAHGEHTIVRRKVTLLVTEWGSTDAPLIPLAMLSPEEVTQGCIGGKEFTAVLPTQARAALLEQ
jgi:hypothetical protein